MSRFTSIAALLCCACFTPVGEPCHGVACRNDGGLPCSAGSTQPCGSSVGECRPGTSECQPNGVWGKCEGGVVPGVEVCDGKDNNCDGQIDEGVGQVCPLQKGVCAGAAGACGGDGGCLQAYGPKYEPIETSCDGLDNDCDGVVDRSVTVNVSQSPGVVSRNAVAVAVPGGESALVLYEEGQKIAARVVRADGTVTDAVSPSVTVDAVERAWAPAVAVGTSLIVAAWAEDTGMTKRVMVASLDGTTGKSTLMGQGSLFALTVTNPLEISIALDEAAGQLALVINDGTYLDVVGFSSTLPPPMGSPSYSFLPLEPMSEHPSVSAAGAGVFLVDWDFLDGRAVRAYVNAMGNAASSSQQPMGSYVASFSSDAGVSESFFAAGGQIFSSSCTVTALVCDTPISLFSATAADALRIAWPAAAAWQEGLDASTVVEAKLSASAGVTLSPGRRPAPVATPQHVLTFFDTESVTSPDVSADEVYFIRSCR